MRELDTIIDLISGCSTDWEKTLSDPATRPDGYLVTMVNPFAVRQACRDPVYLDHLRRFDAVHADGILLARLATRVKGHPVERLSFDGQSMAPDAFRVAARLGLGVYLVGSKPGVAERTAGIIAERYGTRIVGTRHGYFDSEIERCGFIAELAALAPDLVICGMGVTNQERFLVDLKSAGWRGVGVTCGGYLHQTAHGGADTYPEWVNRYHLRALYRVTQEPGRMLRRYLVDYQPFFRQALPMLVRGSRQRT